MVKGVNRAYDVEEERGWLARRLMGLGITLALLLLVVSSMLVGLFGVQLLVPTMESLGLGFVSEGMLAVLRWPLVLLLLSAALAVIYQVAPAERPRWRWTPPGSLFAVLSLMVLSYLLSLAFQQDLFSISWLTYSAFGVLLVVLLWMFIAGLVVLLGGEMNAALDRREKEKQGRRD
jgi:membrane protein